MSKAEVPAPILALTTPTRPNPAPASWISGKLPKVKQPQGKRWGFPAK